ncbi:MAG TPA: FtsQ-type POTRA domain-containing protein [Thermoanaerobaculia bacterium]|nr:FtsQ-type POTRA domain-containing protein [Thermoanaerobaculia bacterium]
MSHARPVTTSSFEPPSFEKGVSPFRRGRPISRRRRRGGWLKPLARLALPAAAVTLPLALVIWVLTSPSFAFAEVVTEGSARVPQAWVREAVSPLLGRNLLLLPLDEVHARVSVHPWVASVGVAKEPPRRLRLTVVEKVPAAVVVVGAEALWVSTEGQIIAPLGSREEPGGVPTLVDLTPRLDKTTPVRTEVPKALAFLAALERAAPKYAKELVALSLLGSGDVQLETAAVPFPLLLPTRGFERRLAELERLLPEIERRYERIEAADLRFSRRILLRPAAPEPLIATEPQQSH